MGIFICEHQDNAVGHKRGCDSRLCQGPDVPALFECFFSADSLKLRSFLNSASLFPIVEKENVFFLKKK